VEDRCTEECLRPSREAQTRFVTILRDLVPASNAQLEYAAAFFLLADCLRDAVNVILTQLKDLQLAIAVTRVYEGERGPILKELLEEKVLPLAAQEGNRWLASWAFWMLHRRDMAVRALIVRNNHSPDLSKSLTLVSLLFTPYLRHLSLQICKPSCS
jgi:hypothetical protein